MQLFEVEPDLQSLLLIDTTIGRLHSSLLKLIPILFFSADRHYHIQTPQQLIEVDPQSFFADRHLLPQADTTAIV